jgi:tetratricopeptide (TPR) repeat protein
MWRSKYLYVIAVIVLGVVLTVVLNVYKTSNRWAKAEELYKGAEYSKIAELLSKESLPNETERLEIYAKSMMATKNYDKAYGAYEKINKDGNSLDAQLMMANIKTEQGKYEEAEKIYMEVIGKNDGFIQAYLNLASTYRIMDRAQMANSILTDGLKKNPNSISILEYLISINSQENDQYQVWKEKLRELDPENDLI